MKIVITILFVIAAFGCSTFNEPGAVWKQETHVDGDTLYYRVSVKNTTDNYISLLRFSNYFQMENCPSSRNYIEDYPNIHIQANDSGLCRTYLEKLRNIAYPIFELQKVKFDGVDTNKIRQLMQEMPNEKLIYLPSQGGMISNIGLVILKPKGTYTEIFKASLSCFVKGGLYKIEAMFPPIMYSSKGAASFEHSMEKYKELNYIPIHKIKPMKCSFLVQ